MTKTTQRRLARLGGTAAGVTLTAALLPTGSAGPAWAAASPQQQLAQVRQATDAFHDLTNAYEAGYSPFLGCFDNPAGGMGQHFLDEQALKDDGAVDLRHPEVLVYEPRPDGDRLVAVEWVVPGPPTMTAPVLMNQTFSYEEHLGVWKLHAWIWRGNPSGTFADWNPNVRPCPAD